jgi:hypothetical protein
MAFLLLNSLRWGEEQNAKRTRTRNKEQEVGTKQRQTERVADNDDLTRKIILSSLVHQHKVYMGEREEREKKGKCIMKRK